MSEKPAKILVMRLSSLGDVVQASAALAPLRAAAAEVHFVTKANFAPLLENHPDIASVYAYQKGKSEREARAKFLAWVQDSGITHVLDLHDSWRTRLWRRALRSKIVVVARKPRLREWLVLWLRLGAWWGFGPGGRAKYYREAAEKMATHLPANSQIGFSTLTTLAVSKDELQAVRSFLPTGDFWIFVPGSAWPQKIWPYYKELARVARVPIVVLGGESDKNCEEIASSSQVRGSISLRGRTNLRESLAVIAQARWIIGNDTGLLHAAEALGKPVAMIEGPTHEYMGFSPYRADSLRIGLPLVCRPCSKNGRLCWRLGQRTCLQGLSVDQVAQELRQAGYPC